MHAGKLVFAQVMDYAPWHTFRRLVEKYRGDFNLRSFRVSLACRLMGFSMGF